MTKVQAFMAKRAGKTNNCTLENAAIRREWYVPPTEQD
jgi:tyrosinase